jgi:hypothetical protein
MRECRGPADREIRWPRGCSRQREDVRRLPKKKIFEFPHRPRTVINLPKSRPPKTRISAITRNPGVSFSRNVRRWPRKRRFSNRSALNTSHSRDLDDYVRFQCPQIQTVANLRRRLDARSADDRALERRLFDLTNELLRFQSAAHPPDGRPLGPSLGVGRVGAADGRVGAAECGV